jgi:hypothetical protein
MKKGSRILLQDTMNAQRVRNIFMELITVARVMLLVSWSGNIPNG